MELSTTLGSKTPTPDDWNDHLNFGDQAANRGSCHLAFKADNCVAAIPRDRAEPWRYAARSNDAVGLMKLATRTGSRQGRSATDAGQVQLRHAHPILQGGRRSCPDHCPRLRDPSACTSSPPLPTTKTGVWWGDSASFFFRVSFRPVPQTTSCCVSACRHHLRYGRQHNEAPWPCVTDARCRSGA